jgi:hypothetical protein
MSAGTAGYLRSEVSDIVFKEIFKELVVAHGTSNAAGQLGSLATGQQSSFSGQALAASVVTGMLSHGVGTHLEILKDRELLQMLVQEQVGLLTGSVIRQEQLRLESVGLSLLGLGLSLGTQWTVQGLQSAFSPAVASSTPVQEAHKNDSQGRRYVEVEDGDYRAGELAGQGHAQGVEHSWYRESEWTSYDSEGNVTQRTSSREWGYVDEHGNGESGFIVRSAPEGGTGEEARRTGVLRKARYPLGWRRIGRRLRLSRVMVFNRWMDFSWRRWRWLAERVVG